MGAILAAVGAVASSIDWGSVAHWALTTIGGASVAAQAIPDGKGGKAVDIVRQLANLVAINWGKDQSAPATPVVSK